MEIDKYLKRIQKTKLMTFKSREHEMWKIEKKYREVRMCFPRFVLEDKDVVVGVKYEENCENS